MAEEELMPFNPEMKKKKKKKKPMLDADGGFMAEPEEGTSAVPQEPTEVKEEEKSVKNTDDFDIDMSYELGKKKKKKKKVTIEDFGETPVETEPEKTVKDTGSFDDMTDDFTNLDLKKKKKKKKPKFTDEDDGEEEMDGKDLDDQAYPDSKSWLGSDRDYTFDELLTRVFDIIREKNPDMVAGEKKKFVMRPPQVLKVGTRKTSFANFADICRLVHRQPKHVLAFLLAELGTSGSVDGNNQLIIRGRYNQKQIENVLRRYIKEYVTCHTCRSPETLLQKAERLFFLQCETCGSRCSVASIKSGFQAVTGRRAAMRARTT